MTEQEIIKYLKENKTRGVAFVFMPKEVKEWACDNSRFVIYYNKFGWDDYTNNIEIYRPTDVIALREAFELKEKPQGGWVEIDIEDDGKFRIDDEEERSAPARETYNWFDWQDFLKDSRFYRRDFTAFGGWQYESNGFWLTQPHVKNEENLLTTLTDCNEDCRPAIPVRIRFWREAK